MYIYIYIYWCLYTFIHDWRCIGASSIEVTEVVHCCFFAMSGSSCSSALDAALERFYEIAEITVVKPQPKKRPPPLGCTPKATCKLAPPKTEDKDDGLKRKLKPIAPWEVPKPSAQQMKKRKLLPPWEIPYKPEYVQWTPSSKASAAREIYKVRVGVAKLR